MATDRSLATLLRALQNPTNNEDASRLLGSATTLLTLLSNPLNITLLTSQVLSAPAVWHAPDGIHTALRVLAVFNSASIHILQRESTTHSPEAFSRGEGLPIDEWIRAVIKGVDERSPRWKHLLALGGLLVGFGASEHHGLSASLRRTLQVAIVTAANLALCETGPTNEMASSSICLVLGHAFEFLNFSDKTQISHDLLLPLITKSILFSKYGLNWGYFLGTMDTDVVQDSSNRFNWSPKSISYFQIHKMSTGPLISSLGLLSRLAAFSVESFEDINLLFQLTDGLSAFTRSLRRQWLQNKFSEIDPAEDSMFLGEETLMISLPLLRQVLKSIMFAVIIIQRAVVGRFLGTSRVSEAQAPSIAIQTLHTLRNIHFISSHVGQNSFSQYTFVFMASVDILSNYPVQAEAFLQKIRPSRLGSVPDHPQTRNLDLFYLNTAEHFTICLTPNANEELIAAACPYLSPGGDPRLLEIFEAAHSVVLAVFLAPQNQQITIQHLPAYVDALFKAFPQNLSPQQFRLAAKTLVRITGPPSIISSLQPLLSSMLLEMVYTRVQNASGDQLPQSSQRPQDAKGPQLSEQAVFVLTLIDCLPVLSIDGLEEWLPLTAIAIHSVKSHQLLHICKERFWEVLNNGEMDVARAEICVTWWNTHRGRELVFPQQMEDGGLLLGSASHEMSKL